jgi:putative nucleotidyltransferase with HDIG domain
MTTTTETQRALDKIISTIGDLPTTPAIIVALTNLTSDINTDIRKITRAIMADQSLTAKVLKLSNSSFYGRAKEVKTLHEAVIILGFMTLHSLIIATSTQTLYQKTVNDGVSGKLWEHAFAAALASRLVAQAVHFPYIEEAFIGGLLHDIGKLVLMQKTPKEYQRIISDVEKARGSFADHEEAVLGFNHTHVGSLLLQKWSFPQELIDAVEQHHCPTGSDGDSRLLPFIINVGNYMAKSLEVGFNDFTVDDLSGLTSASTLNLDAARLEEIQAQLKEHYDNEQDFFRLGT